MSVVKVSRKPWGSYVRFTCPGCKTWHVITTRDDGADCWTFNGDAERPTISPSILVSGVQPISDAQADQIAAGRHIEPRPMACHSFVRDGRIEFLSDCTHELAGQTVPLPPIDGGVA